MHSQQAQWHFLQSFSLGKKMKNTCLADSNGKSRNYFGANRKTENSKMKNTLNAKAFLKNSFQYMKIWSQTNETNKMLMNGMIIQTIMHIL